VAKPIKQLNKEKTVLIIIFSLLTVIQFLVANTLQYHPNYDAESVFVGAIGFATTGTLPNPSYFATFGNQWGILLFLSALFGITQFFTQNFFMVYAGVLIVIVNTGLYALYNLVKMRFSQKTAFIVLAIVLVYPPIYVFPSVIYTDVASIAMPIVALNLFYRLTKCETPRKRVILSILLGLTLAIGTAFKITVLIVFIAMVMLTWAHKERLKIYKGLLIASAVIAVFHAALTINYRSHISSELRERHQTPWFQWVVMGLEDEGLADNMWGGTNVGHFYRTTFYLETFAEREAFIREEFTRLTANRTVSDWSRLFVHKYIVLHYRADFAPGGTIVFSDTDTGFKAWFRDVRFTPLYIWYHRAIIYTIILLAYISIFFKKRDFVASLALLGMYMFFIFLCEVRPRLLTNQFFIFFYLAAISIDGIICKLKGVKAELKNIDNLHE